MNLWLASLLHYFALQCLKAKVFFWNSEKCSHKYLGSKKLIIQNTFPCYQLENYENIVQSYAIESHHKMLCKTYDLKAKVFWKTKFRNWQKMGSYFGTTKVFRYSASLCPKMLPPKKTNNITNNMTNNMKNKLYYQV